MVTWEEEIRRRDRRKAQEGIRKMQSGYYGKGLTIPFQRKSEDVEKINEVYPQNPIANTSTCIGVREFFICLPEDALENLKCEDVDEENGKAHVCSIPSNEKPGILHLKTPAKEIKKPEVEEEPENRYDITNLPGGY